MKRLTIFVIVGLIFSAVQIDPAQAQPYNLGDRVWYDQDHDGIQDSNEPGYNGITVDLYDNTACSGTPMASTTSGATGPAGFYQFTGLPGGSYCVQFGNIPAGWSISPADQGADGTLDSDANGSAQIPNISLSVNDDTQDMGIYVSGSLGDSVLCDSTALANITVELFEDFNDDGVADDSAIATTETDSTGFYLFTGLEVALAGDTSNTTAYILRVDVLDPDLGSCNILVSSDEFNPLLDSDNPNDPNNDFIFAYAQDYCDTEGKPISLTFKYTGGTCAASDNSQAGDKWSCSGDIYPTEPVTVAITGASPPYNITPTGSISPDGVFIVTKSGELLGSHIHLSLSNSGVTQELEIHTSCSTPLVYGDVFGSLTLVGYIGQCTLNLSATYVSGGVQLTWTDTGADHYNVYRSSVSGGPYVLMGSTSDETFLDDTVITGTTYYYVVRPANSSDYEVCQSVEISGLVPEPEEQIDEIIDEFESSVEDGDLIGDGPGASADGRLTAFGNMLETAQTYIDSGDLTSACIELEAAYRKCDGAFPPPDFVTGPAATEMATSIQILMDTIGCE